MSRTHGMTGTVEFKAWRYMLNRCFYPSGHHIKHYGRKIKIHNKWTGSNGFISFLNHIGRAPSNKHTVDRIDNNKGYIPGNVRWATKLEQARNKKANHMIKAFGKIQCISAWSEETGIGQRTIWYRVRAGWSGEDAVSKPVRKQKNNQ